jgi:hypothetical protein
MENVGMTGYLVAYSQRLELSSMDHSIDHDAEGE